MDDSDIISMPRVTVDGATAAKLRGLGEPMEFRDEAGNVLGTFQPDESSPAFRAWLRSLDPGISEEEFQRRINSPGQYTTDEVIVRLRGHSS